MNIIYWLDIIGTLVFAISGVLAASYKKFDVVGATVIGMVTAIGGGTLRDLLIGSTPVGWMTNNVYIYVIVIAIPFSYLFKKQILKLPRSMFLFDTIGIGLFTIHGINKTLELGLSPLVALLMGITSAVFGGGHSRCTLQCCSIDFSKGNLCNSMLSRRSCLFAT